jgi:hypothetical protein
MFFVHFRLCLGIQDLLFLLFIRRRISIVVKVSYLAKLLGPFSFDIVDWLQLSKHCLLLLAVLLSEIIREIFIFISVVIIAMGRVGVRNVLALFFKPIQGRLHLLLALSHIGSRILTIREERELLIVYRWCRWSLGFESLPLVVTMKAKVVRCFKVGSSIFLDLFLRFFLYLLKLSSCKILLSRRVREIVGCSCFSRATRIDPFVEREVSERGLNIFVDMIVSHVVV